VCVRESERRHLGTLGIELPLKPRDGGKCLRARPVILQEALQLRHFALQNLRVRFRCWGLKLWLRFGIVVQR